MTSLLAPIGAVLGLAAGAAGLWFEHPVFSSNAPFTLTLGIVLSGYVLLRATYYRSGTPWPADWSEPRPLHLGWLDYLKVPVEWFDAFKRSYAVEPGLYYTGDHYDREAPLLVTSNYHLTVFLVARRARAFNARILVIDTDAINVWCAAGKGAFSNARIHEQLDRFDRKLLTESTWLTLILPKVGFSGVDLRSLRKEKIRPVIGPLLAKQLPEYLAHPPYRDRDSDRIIFGLQSRTFSWLPSLTQFLGYSLALWVVLLAVEAVWAIPAPLGLVGLTALIATAYPLLFPFIPGRRFAVKALWLASAVSLGLAGAFAIGWLSWPELAMAAPFSFATSVFFGLSYTGNSAVSNYSRVRKEIARFLPLDILLYAASLVAFLITGDYR